LLWRDDSSVAASLQFRKLLIASCGIFLFLLCVPSPAHPDITTGQVGLEIQRRGGEASKPIIGAATYNLTCLALTGTLPQSAPVNILPNFQEL